MERIDDIMERLKGQMPQVPDADALTDSIMAAIDGVEQKKDARIIPMWVKLVRTVSSVAAVMLMLLLLNLNADDNSADMAQTSVVGRFETSLGSCEDCTVKDIYKIALERREKRIKSETLKQKLYASYNF